MRIRRYLNVATQFDPLWTLTERKNERMMPIVISIIPTLVGAAMLVGLNGSHEKGALLFGGDYLLMEKCQAI